MKPALNVNWYKDGEKIEVSRWKSKTNEKDDYWMTITPILETDFGDYVCKVSLPMFDETSEIQHRVYKETILHSETRVAEIDSFKDNDKNENDDITFDCEYEVSLPVQFHYSILNLRMYYPFFQCT